MLFFRRAIVLLVIAVLLMSAGLSMIVDRLILFPSRDPVEAGEAVRKPVEGTNLEFWVHSRAGSKSGAKPKLRILHFIGNASRAEWEHPIFLDALVERFDVEAWVLNYPGYGGSGGVAKLGALPAAAESAYAAMKKIAGDVPLLISGNSLGTTVALYLASRHPVQGLVLQNPPPIQNMIVHRFGWWNLWLVALPVTARVPRELNSLENAPGAKAPAVVLTSERDITVPPKFQRKVVDAYRGAVEQMVMPGVGHDTELPRELRGRVLGAVSRILGVDGE